jgi:preprotein translocase subunit YajC
MFINDAIAQVSGAAPAATMGSTFGTIGMLVVFVGAFYFLVLKPQANQIKKQKEIMNGMKKGDVVVCASGIVGKIVKLHSDQIVLVEISDNVVVRVEKDRIAEIIDKEHYFKLPVQDKAVKPAKTKKDK